MNDFDDSYRAVPLHIMAASLIVMMILDFMPFSFDGFFWLPEMTALMLLYWTLHQPQRAGMGLAFAIGLIVDAATAATLGLHALSYVVMTYFIFKPPPPNHAFTATLCNWPLYWLHCFSIRPF